MKKLVIVFIFIMFFSQFAFSDEVDVSSFIGAYTGYGHRMADNRIYDHEEFNYLMFGISIRFGLSYEISDDLKLYFLSLFDFGSYINFTPEFLSLYLHDDIIFGGEIKAKYKSFFVGLGSGMGLHMSPLITRYLLLRPSFGYNIKPNLLLDVFVDLDNVGIVPRPEGTDFRLGFTFYFFK
jgi:hypothetical protein